MCNFKSLFSESLGGKAGYLSEEQRHLGTLGTSWVFSLRFLGQVTGGWALGLSLPLLLLSAFCSPASELGGLPLLCKTACFLSLALCRRWAIAL